MTLPVIKITAAIKKSSVRREYPGGIAGFRKDYPDATEDGYIFRGHDYALPNDRDVQRLLQAPR